MISDNALDNYYGVRYYGSVEAFRNAPYWTDDDLDILEEEDGEETH